MSHEMTETVGRYLDGDLSDREVADVRRLLESDTRWHETYESLLGLRSAMRAIAADEEPPEALDTLVKPLRQAGRPRTDGFSVLPLVAAAAAVVLWVVVGVTVGRHPWKPEPTRPFRPFVLQPLPSATGRVALGPLERLLEWRIPEPELRLPDALVVLGPLPDPPGMSRRAGVRLEVCGREFPIRTEADWLGATVAVRVAEGRVVACDGGPPSLCADLLGRLLDGVTDGSHRAQVSPSD